MTALAATYGFKDCDDEDQEGTKRREGMMWH